MSDEPNRPQDRLEDALCRIGGVASVLLSIRSVEHDSLDAEASGYLGGRLREHRDQAHDAFCEIYNFGKYRK